MNECNNIWDAVNRNYRALPFGPIAFMRPDRLVPSGWTEHIPFGFWLMEAKQPVCMVELGTHTGLSYSAFLQAASRLELPLSAFAVDTWTGDEHSGIYDESVYEEFKKYHDDRYSHISSLLRMTFEEASEQFPDRSIDLLHIDGFHTYDAVARDFETWRPKLTSDAMVLFHDTNERRAGWGVWRFWEEVQSEAPHAFEFVHGHGLGVLSFAEELDPGLEILFRASDNARERGLVRNVYASLGGSLQRLKSEADLRARDNENKAQIESLEQKLSKAEDERDRERERSAGLEEALKAEREDFKEQVESLQSRERNLEGRVEALEGRNEQFKEERDWFEREWRSSENRVEAMGQSTSWRVTRPIRWVGDHAPGVKKFFGLSRPEKGVFSTIRGSCGAAGQRWTQASVGEPGQSDERVDGLEAEGSSHDQP